MVTLVCVVGFAGWFSWQNHRFEHLAALPSQSMQAELTVQPDAISIRGGQYQLVANGSVGRVLVRGQLKSAHDKQWLQRVTRRTSWRAQGTLASIDPPTNPGQFDAPTYYRSQGIAQQLTLTQVFQIQAAPRTGWLGIVDRLHQWRWAFAQRCQQLPPMLARYASSLLVGLRPADFQSTMGTDPAAFKQASDGLLAIRIIAGLSNLGWWRR